MDLICDFLSLGFDNANPEGLLGLFLPRKDLAKMTADSKRHFALLSQRLSDAEPLTYKRKWCFGWTFLKRKKM